jgi:hypothetical protein
MNLLRPARSIETATQKKHAGALPSLFEPFSSKEIVGCPQCGSVRPPII